MADGYKNHRPGSVAGAVHKVFDEKGKDAAKKKGESLGLEPHTVRSMISLWERKIFSRTKDGSGKKKSKKSAKRVVRGAAKRVVRGAKKAAKRVVRKVTAKKAARVVRPVKKAAAESAAA